MFPEEVVNSFIKRRIYQIVKLWYGDFIVVSEYVDSRQ